MSFDSIIGILAYFIRGKEKPFDIIPIGVQRDRNLLGIQNHFQISALVALRIFLGEKRGGMQRLVNVADEMLNPAEIDRAARGGRMGILESAR